MLKKIASFAAMLTGALTIASCQTAMYKPIICQPGTALKDGRCQKVPQSVKEATRTTSKAPDATKPKYRSKKVTTAPDDGPGIQAPLFQPPRARQNVYGLPIN